MKKYTYFEIVALLQQNNQDQPKAKYSNNAILRMLENLPTTFTMEVEPTKGGFALNRGSVVECIINAIATKNYNQVKHQANKSDLNTLKLDADTLRLFNNIKSSNIEIKFSTSFAPATRKTNKARYTIIVSEKSIVMLESKNIVYTASGKINASNQRAKDCTELKDLMDLLGY
jgi:hypothetical protein